MAPPVSLKMRVQRSPPELVTPAKPTPNIFKQLSDIDDGESLRFQIPAIQFYKNNPSMKEKNPAKVIKEAVAKALVWYYPLAGRLREGPGKKLFVECTGEGIIFIEAEADVSLDQFGDSLQPPFPCLEELLFDVPGSSAILHCPLLLIQVTRLKCGGFIFALRLNHTMSDGIGLVQFLKAVSEIARGAHAPSISPVWQRHLLNARDTPRVTCTHHEFEPIEEAKDTIIPLDDINMVQRSFLFASTDISTIRKLIPPHLQKCSTFELITACLWRCHTIALQPDPEEQVRMIYIVNIRNKLNPPLPIGYYGNGFVYPAAQTTARNLCQNPLGYALELVKKAKEEVTEEYVRSVADLMVIKGRPHFKLTRSYLVSDLSRIGFEEVDFGWGKPIYGGVAKGGLGDIPNIASFYVPVKNHKGENGIVVPIFLPEPAMERFVKELDALLKRNHQCQQKSQVFIRSAI